jgi:hypothetical protein
MVARLLRVAYALDRRDLQRCTRHRQHPSALSRSPRRHGVFSQITPTAEPLITHVPSANLLVKVLRALQHWLNELIARLEGS